MPRQLAQSPKYRHYRPKDLAVVRIDGHDHYLGKHGSPESWERYHRLLADRATTRGVSPPPPATQTAPASSGQTVSGLILAFWEYAQEHYRRPDGTPSEELGNLKAALRPVRKLYGLTPASGFGPLALRSVRQEMIRSGLARSSINDRVNRIRRAFRWAASLELVPVGVQVIRKLLGPAGRAADLGEVEHQGEDLAMISGVGPAVRTASGTSEGSTISVCFVPGLRRSSGLGPVASPPPKALTVTPSMITVPVSSLPAFFRRPSRSTWSRSQIPASSQARSLRWAVRPEQPSSFGTSSQRMPAVRTNQMTRKAVWWSILGRPPLGPMGCSGGR